MRCGSDEGGEDEDDTSDEDELCAHLASVTADMSESESMAYEVAYRKTVLGLRELVQRGIDAPVGANTASGSITADTDVRDQRQQSLPTGTTRFLKSSSEIKRLLGTPFRTLWEACLHAVLTDEYTGPDKHKVSTITSQFNALVPHLLAAGLDASPKCEFHLRKHEETLCTIISHYQGTVLQIFWT